MPNINIKRRVREEGVVLSKEFKAATESWTDKNGRTVPAQPDRYVVKVASGCTIDKINGIDSPTILDYKVEEKEFDNFKYLDKVVCLFEISTFGEGSATPVSLTLKNN